VAAEAGRDVATLNDTFTTNDTTIAPAESDFLPGPVVLLGAPGVGKGTQAKLLMSEFGIPQISTGDLLRANIAQGTELGKKAKSLMDQGQLVDDETVNKMVADRLDTTTHQDVVHGFILDGYPRTAAQSAYIEDLLSSSAAAAHQDLPLIAIDINVDETELLHRITGRRSCPTCNHIYNIYSHPPKAEGVCDYDGSPLQQRSDDTEAAFGERMKEYRAKTEEVIRYFSQKAEHFETVNGDQPVEKVSADILAALHRLRIRVK
jgi:adenylate kinase